MIIYLHCNQGLVAVHNSFAPDALQMNALTRVIFGLIRQCFTPEEKNGKVKRHQKRCEKKTVKNH